MSTFMAKKGSIERKWYVIDAAGKPMGKTAVIAADLLRGKRKPEFTPNADCGDCVIIINAELAMKLAVKGMMPKNSLSRDALTRLHIYRGGEHNHAAQKPELWDAE